MTSSKEDSTAAAAGQLGSVSLGGASAERKDNDTGVKNGTTTPTEKLCSACGKTSDAVKKCTACKCVWYCNKECQNKHRREHRKECKCIKKELEKRGGKLNLGTELDVGPLGKLPPREVCPICMRVLPIHTMLHATFSCCGKTICGGCDMKHQMESEEGTATCAFCREPIIESDEEILAQTRKRVELKDPQALCNMGGDYGSGRLGLPEDQIKCIDFLRQSADLGCLGALFQLGDLHRLGMMGLEKNEEEALQYWEKAAEGGCVVSGHYIASIERKNGDHVASLRHWRLSASGGLKASTGALINRFEDGLINHGDLAETLQAFYLARDEMKSEDRDQFIKHLKLKGEYEEDYDAF